MNGLICKVCKADVTALYNEKCFNCLDETQASDQMHLAMLARQYKYELEKYRHRYGMWKALGLPLDFLHREGDLAMDERPEIFRGWLDTYAKARLELVTYGELGEVSGSLKEAILKARGGSPSPQLRGFA